MDRSLARAPELSSPCRPVLHRARAGALLSGLLIGALWAAQASSAEPAAAPLRPHVVVLEDGRRLEALSAPVWAFGRAGLRLTDGRAITLRWNDVDHDATRAANPPRQTAADGANGSPRVWTNDDLARLRRRGGVSFVGKEGEVLQDGAGGEAFDEPSGPDPAEEERWRSRAVGLKQVIARHEAELAHLERARRSWEAFTVGTGDYQRAAASELGEIRRRREVVERELRQAKGELVRLEEAARRAGVPPGWLRPKTR